MSQTVAEIDQDSITEMTASRRLFVLLSPLAVIGLGHLTARLFSHFIGVWAWVPLMIEYWFVMALVIYLSGGSGQVISAYRRNSRWTWWLLGVVVGLIPLPVLLLNSHLLHDSRLVFLWLLEAAINPFIEEGYWRGLFGQVTHRWPAFFACLYPTIFFTAGHPLQFGVFSIGCRTWEMMTSLLIMGAVWSIIYRYTRSLRVAVFSHMLVDLGNMSVWVFLNLYIPPGMR
jgi:hypothetical protein